MKASGSPDKHDFIIDLIMQSTREALISLVVREILHWKLHIVTAALQNKKFVENLWEIYVSLLALYVTLQQPQKV